jgi:hypothetical protein
MLGRPINKLPGTKALPDCRMLEIENPASEEVVIRILLQCPSA